MTSNVRLSDLWNPSQVFPSLTSLTLLDKNNRIIKLCSMPTVTHLTIQSPVYGLLISQSFGVFEGFQHFQQYRVLHTLLNCPASLTSLEADPTPDDIPMLLARLTRLRADLYIEKVQDRFELSSYPRNVYRALQASSGILPRGDEVWCGPESAVLNDHWITTHLTHWSNLTTLRTYGVRLESLDIVTKNAHFDVGALSLLPPRLESLKISGPSTPSHHTWSSNLPRQMTSLSHCQDFYTYTFG